MKLKQSYLKRKVDNTVTYQFKNDFNEVSILEITKLKSGYTVEYNSSHNNFFKHTNGLKNLKDVNKFIEPFNF